MLKPLTTHCGFRTASRLAAADFAGAGHIATAAFHKRAYHTVLLRSRSPCSCHPQRDAEAAQQGYAWKRLRFLWQPLAQVCPPLVSICPLGLVVLSFIPNQGPGSSGASTFRRAALRAATRTLPYSPRRAFWRGCRRSCPPGRRSVPGRSGPPCLCSGRLRAG